MKLPKYGHRPTAVSSLLSRVEDGTALSADQARRNDLVHEWIGLASGTGVIDCAETVAAFSDPVEVRAVAERALGLARRSDSPVKSKEYEWAARGLSRLADLLGKK
jgi:hypothetical protein